MNRGPWNYLIFFPKLRKQILLKFFAKNMQNVTHFTILPSDFAKTVSQFTFYTFFTDCGIFFSLRGQMFGGAQGLRRGKWSVGL